MGLVTKTDNANLASKLALRRHMLQRHHADGDIRVFDCCQGDGVIWSKLRDEFEVRHYWGVDVKPKRGRLKVDSARVVCQPGLNCNVIDIDTYGMPWAHWNGLLPSISEPTTVFLTIGLSTTSAGIKMPPSVREKLGLPGDWEIPRGFTEALVNAAMMHFLGEVSPTGFRVVEAFESTRHRKNRYLAVRVDRPVAALPEPQRKRPPQKR